MVIISLCSRPRVLLTLVRNCLLTGFMLWFTEKANVTVQMPLKDVSVACIMSMDHGSLLSRGACFMQDFVLVFTNSGRNIQK